MQIKGSASLVGVQREAPPQFEKMERLPDVSLRDLPSVPPSYVNTVNDESRQQNPKSSEALDPRHNQPQPLNRLSSKTERAQCYASFRPKVVQDPSSEPKVDQRQQTKPLKQGLGVVGVNPPGRSLPTMSVNSIQSSAFGGDRTIGTGHSTIAAVHHWMPQMGPMQRGNAGSNQLSGGVPSIGVNSNQALAYVDRKIGTGQDTAAMRHHSVRASAVPPFARYPRPLLEADRSFFSGPLSLAPTGLGGTGPFGSADPSSKMSMLSRLASHRLAKPSVRLDPTTGCAVKPEGHCNPLDDGFSKLERLEAAWAAREKNENVSYTNHLDRV